MKNKRLFVTALALLLVCVFALTGLVGCKKDDTDSPEGDNDINPNLDLSTPVNLVIAGRNEAAWPALETVITKFENKYSNCTVTYEFVQGDLSVFTTRLQSDTDKIDIFVADGIQSDSELVDYALNLLADPEALDLSDTNEGLVKNYKYHSAENTQYSIPYGGEMRGLYVNKTLLSQFDLDVPTNRTELLHCCEVLYANGYIPFHSACSDFAQQLMYPAVCNRIVNEGNYEANYAAASAIDDGISEYFRDEFTFLYEIVSKGYYDYKRVEEEIGYTFSGYDGKALDFLNVTKDESGTLHKNDDMGRIAFMTSTQAFQLNLDQKKADYHSAIEYEFILAPVGTVGGYAYMSPSKGFAVNKKSDNTDWALEFLSFILSAEVNKAFAAEQGCIPNTTDALVRFNVPANRVSTVGQVTFDYKFYNCVKDLMCEGWSKDTYIAVNEKYLTANPEETFYYKAEDNSYVAADEAYLTANPTATLYRLNEEMIGISKMNATKYMTKGGYIVADAAYRQSHPVSTYYYKTGDEYTATTLAYLTEHPNAELYIVEYTVKYTLEDYMERLENSFQIAKDSR